MFVVQLLPLDWAINTSVAYLLHYVQLIDLTIYETMASRLYNAHVHAIRGATEGNDIDALKQAIELLLGEEDNEDEEYEEDEDKETEGYEWSRLQTYVDLLLDAATYNNVEAFKPTAL